MDNKNQYITRANSLYKVLYYANALGIEKSILDCGAGGRNPPLYLFYIYGFKCSGIDIAEDSICKAHDFEKTNNCFLNIENGDFRSINRANNSYGCCYSYNSVFHMNKTDVVKSIKEMIRVTNNDGLIYFNVLSKNDMLFGKGREVELDTFYDDDEKTVHSFWGEEEIEEYINKTAIVEKDIINMKIKHNGCFVNQSFIEYFISKN